jgi:hypothetical protein
MEFLLATQEGLTFIKVDPTYQDYDIEILDRYFKGNSIWRIANVS